MVGVLAAILATASKHTDRNGKGPPFNRGAFFIRPNHVAAALVLAVAALIGYLTFTYFWVVLLFVESDKDRGLLDALTF